MGPSFQNLVPVASAAAENRVCGEQGGGDEQSTVGDSFVPKPHVVRSSHGWGKVTET